MDREKVINSLGRCSCGVPDACRDCDYDNYPARICVQHLTADALALLKEQEAVKPVLDKTSKRFYRCGACGECVGFIDLDVSDQNEQDNYCRNCGKSVDWITL